MLWLGNSSLIGQMAQSVVIGRLWSDWSGGLVCCDWGTLLWLVRCPSLLWLVYSSLIGQMVQSVVIGLLYSHLSTLLWLVRWPGLLWLVYSALIGQIAQSVVIGLLCSDWTDGQSVVIGLLYSDWSDGPVCCDWSTMLWLDRWPSLLWLVYSTLIGQMAQSVGIGLISLINQTAHSILICLLFSDWSDDQVCCDWSTLLWFVRCPSLLWLVYSALIGQMAPSIVIGLLCSSCSFWQFRVNYLNY